MYKEHKAARRANRATRRTGPVCCPLFSMCWVLCLSSSYWRRECRESCIVVVVAHAQSREERRHAQTGVAPLLAQAQAQAQGAGAAAAALRAACAHMHDTEAPTHDVQQHTTTARTSTLHCYCLLLVFAL
jgi:hypothetical protein